MGRNLIFLLAITAGFFSEMTLAGDATKGKAIYASCVQCHGENGIGLESTRAPKLKGQYDWYIETALKDFLSGARKNSDKLPFINKLSESDIKDVAAYLSSLK